jgi:predicted lipid-binding transport protein (Tim44 family)
MGRFRGLPAVLAMLLGGAALALAAGAVAYVFRSRTGGRADNDSGEPADSPEFEEAARVEDPPALGEQVAAELAETEAASEAALEFQALEAYVPPEREGTTTELPSPLGLPAPAARAERTLPLSARWTLMAAAVLVGALVGLMLFLLTGGTIGR